ncbi:hypothetical protein V494_02992 [Pseudogymnoascus sp. VKM F-4513 (FW-928)]|nr:hypothetical protein V494_02992 [Pseudogymnoascus sp. VKM F-4513 (FW-928)]
MDTYKDAASKLNAGIRTHLIMQLVFTVLRVPSLILTVFAIASFSNFFALPDAPNMPQPTKNAIGVATFTLSAISLLLATLCDLAGLYFFPYRKPLRAACTCYLPIRIRLEQVTFWLLINSTFAVIFNRSYQRHSLAAGVPSYEAPQKCFMFLAAMNFVRILFMIANKTLGRVVEVYTNLMEAMRAAATRKSGEELPSCRNTRLEGREGAAEEALEVAPPKVPNTSVTTTPITATAPKHSSSSSSSICATRSFSTQRTPHTVACTIP